MLRLWATQIRYVVTIATQIRYVAALRDLNKVCCDPCDSKWVCCYLVRPNYSRDFLCATLSRYKTTSCVPKKIWCDHCDLKWVCCDFVRPECLNFCAILRDSKQICCDLVRPRKNISTKFDRVQKISTKFDQGKKSHVATLHYPNKLWRALCDPLYLCCDFERPKVAVLQLFVTQSGFAATLCDPK